MDGYNKMSKKYNNKTIDVMGQKWKIVRVAGLKEAGIMGKCIFAKKMIALDASLKDYDLEHTLLHELGHALIYRSSIYQSLPHEIEEILVDIFGTFLLDNFSLKIKDRRK